jgi:hypothetical protein
MKITVELRCKPQVAQYINNRYGTPVVFPHNDFLHSLLIRYLQRPDKEYEQKVTLQHYTKKVQLPITMREYERYGNVLTNTSIMHINQTIIDNIEELLYMYLHFHYRVCGIPLKLAIQKFRQQYFFPEECYSTDAITKYWQRTEKRRNNFATNLIAETVLLPQARA